jgi:DNA polymerase III alpha subunit
MNTAIGRAEAANLSDRRLRLALDVARQLMGAPRDLSQHPGGFVLTHGRLDDLVPIEPAAFLSSNAPGRLGAWALSPALTCNPRSIYTIR